MRLLFEEIGGKCFWRLLFDQIVVQQLVKKGLVIGEYLSTLKFSRKLIL
jgi:hypothetical protein